MWILSRIKLYLAITGAVIVSILGAYMKGRSAAGAQRDQERADDYIKTRQAVDDTPDAIDDAGGAREWLYERSRKRGGNL